MGISRSAFVRFISLLLIVTSFVGVLTSCKDSKPPLSKGSGSPEPPQSDVKFTATPTLTDTEGIDGMYTSSNYVKKYSDNDSLNTWIKENITDSDLPPVTFQVNGKSSSDYKWEKSLGENKKVIYFEKEENPSQSTEQIINYISKELSLRIEFTLITYTDYPVVEYTAILYNLH